jgi:hypothetical protein
MPFCSACGTPHADAANFCPSCGGAVRRGFVPPQVHITSQPPSPDGPAVRGWLLFLCLAMTVFTPIGLLFTAAIIANGNPAIALATLALTALMIVAGVRLWLRKPGAPEVAMVAIGVNALMSVVTTGAIASEIPPDAAVGNILGPLIWGGIWIRYLQVSKRVKATFPEAPQAPQQAQSW